MADNTQLLKDALTQQFLDRYIPNQKRAHKIMSAMGLNPGHIFRNMAYSGEPQEDTTSYKAFYNLTGETPHDLVADLDDWDKSSGFKVMLSKMYMKHKFNQLGENGLLGEGNKYIKQALDYSQGQPLTTAKILNVDKTMKDPVLKNRLLELFSNINRPADLDKIPVENVTSRIIPN